MAKSTAFQVKQGSKVTIGTEASVLSGNPIDILFYQLAQFIETNMTITFDLPV